MPDYIHSLIEVMATKPSERPLASHRAWSLVVNPPRNRPSASVSWISFLCQLHSDVLGLLCCRSCRRRCLAPPNRQAFRALRRTRQSPLIVGSGERRCSTCDIRPANDAIARLSAPSKTCLRSTAGYSAPGGNPGHVQRATMTLLTLIHRPIRQFARPTLPPKRQP